MRPILRRKECLCQNQLHDIYTAARTADERSKKDRPKHNQAADTRISACISGMALTYRDARPRPTGSAGHETRHGSVGHGFAGDHCQQSLIRVGHSFKRESNSRRRRPANRRAVSIGMTTALNSSETPGVKPLSQCRNPCQLGGRDRDPLLHSESSTSCIYFRRVL